MKKIGILGGGQLGKMFLQNAHNYPYEFSILDPNIDAAAKRLAHHFVQGNFNDYQTVLDFGRKLDILTIEIEHVNTKALYQLEKEGVQIFPKPSTLEIIQDKGKQKQFYKRHSIPSAHFYLIENKNEIDFEEINFPFIQKLRTGGYDGKAVQIIKDETDLEKIWDLPSLIEKTISIEKEIAIIVAKGSQQTHFFEPIEMIFDDELNLVRELFTPANISESQKKEIESIALQTAELFDGNGLFAFEFFITKKGEILLNEVAPRAHNSGHHTIENSHSSQFDSLLRIIAKLSLIDLKNRTPATLINLVGEKEHNGEIHYKGLKKILKLDKVFFHDYGKKITKAGRKMGHVTILGERNSKTIDKIEFIKKHLKVHSK